VRQPVRRIHRDLQCGRVRDACPVAVGGRDTLLFRERLDLCRRAMDDDHADTQRAEHRHVLQEHGKVLVRDNHAVNRQHERLLAELRDVLQDAPQIGRFHLQRKK